MRYVPDPSVTLLTEEQFPDAIGPITEKLQQYRQEGYFSSREGKQLYYEYFLAQDSKASVVIVHGLSEFTKKYYEITYYLLNQGYSVFVYDQRGHGLSFREVEPVDLMHVGRFDDYTEDLERFITQVVKPAEDGPVYLYAHSMGGAVAAQYAARKGQLADKVVLSAPMIEPVVKGATPQKARIGLGLVGLFKGYKTRFWGSRDFDPHVDYKRDMDKSYNRFRHNLNMRIAEPRYQSTPMTIGWIYNSLCICPKLMRLAGKITVPVLLVSGETDQVVNNEKQKQFAEKCPACHMVTIPNMPHAMLAGSYEGMEMHMKLVLDFFASDPII